MDLCPTGAIIAPGVVDARRCLAWHVQQKGDLPHEFRVALDDRLYGCDECQEVCPPSRREETRTRVDPPPGPAPAEGAPGSWVDLLWVLDADDVALMDRLGRWYVPDRDPRYLRRNALVALANSVAAHRAADPHVPEVGACLARYLDGADDLLAGHAAWAALRVGRGDLLATPTRASRGAVAAELARWPDEPPSREDGAR
jgi:epoxyqueuosine reductase